MADILQEVRIKADRQTVYAAISTAAGVRNWWTRDVELDQRVGGEGVFRFATATETRFTKVRVDELTAPSRVVWMVTSAVLPEWPGTTIEFDLRNEGAETVLDFAQRGYAEEGACYAMCTPAWAHFMGSLQQYAETGVGYPYEVAIAA